ncbi:MAG: hypothetical protein HY329_00475 [Chloroflexi bacterium]|nr:hypothetical protein [Chloroflexota bacterium]
MLAAVATLLLACQAGTPADERSARVASPARAAVRTATAGPSPTPVRLDASYPPELRRVAEASARVKSFRAHQRITGGAIGSETAIEYVRPDRKRLTTTVTLAGQSSARELIFIGRRVWTSETITPGHPPAWREGVPIAGSRPFDELADTSFLGSPVSVTRGSDGTARSGPCQIWENPSERRRVCLGPNDNLPYWSTSFSEGHYVELEFYDFDAEIRIEPPT